MKVTRVETRPLRVSSQPIGSALGEIAFLRLHSRFRSLRCRHRRREPDLHPEQPPHQGAARDGRRTGRAIVGRDAGHIAGFWSRAWKDINFLGHKGVPVVGISALDGALWDAFGKAAGCRCTACSAARTTAFPPITAAGSGFRIRSKNWLRRRERFVAAGFRAMKMRLGMPDPAIDIARVRAVREAIGPRITLMADANQGLTESQAIRLGRALEEFDLTWFEEPLPAWDLDGLARVAAALDTPIASGETEYTRYGFRRMLELRSRRHFDA